MDFVRPKYPWAVFFGVSADIVGELYDCFAAELKESVDEV